MLKRISKEKRAYLISFVVMLLFSCYPIYMGIKVLSAFFKDGQVDVSIYPKYIIPYTPISIAVLVCLAIIPISVKCLKKMSHLGLSVLGIGLFLLTEILIEGITVFKGYQTSDIGNWQAYMCFVSPTAITKAITSTIGEELTARYNPAFKLHFYLIAILMIVAIIGIAHGFYIMYMKGTLETRNPLIIQTVSTFTYIGLCIFACFTAFYRTGGIDISPLSSLLMSIFFIVFGVTAGCYFGGILFGKKPIFSRFVPAIIATLTTSMMYIGELILMGGILFSFGKGFLFTPIASCPLAPIDFIVIILAGVVTYIILFMIRLKEKKERV